jgi:biopolymer transport protein ExbB
MISIWDWINSFFPLIEKGGIMMWPIIILSIVAFAIILERAWTLVIRSELIVPKGLVKEVEARLSEGEIEEAVVACRKSESMISRILIAGLMFHDREKSEIREALEDAGRHESHELDRFLGMLAAVAGVSPLMGLLGTVFGMIDIFNEIAGKNIGQYESMAGGIYVALYTTAAGLIVAIPAYLAFRAFSGIAEYRTREMEDVAINLINHLDKKQMMENGNKQDEVS